MFDEKMRGFKDAVFQPVAVPLQKVAPEHFSVMGLVVGLATAVVLWQQLYVVGFILWFLNRVFDALDGSVARLRGVQSDFGGYVDILVDFVVYATIPVGLAAGVAETAVTSSLIFLLCTFYLNAASWMYLSAILEKRSSGQTNRLTTVNMPPGLIGGTETIIFYTAFIFFPSQLGWLFALMGLLIIITIGQRVRWAARHLA